MRNYVSLFHTTQVFCALLQGKRHNDPYIFKLNVELLGFPLNFQHDVFLRDLANALSENDR